MDQSAEPTVATGANVQAEQMADALVRGFRRLCWQWVEVAGGGGRAMVMAVRHRRPVALPVSTAVADVLRRRGLPTVVRSAVGGS